MAPICWCLSDINGTYKIGNHYWNFDCLKLFCFWTNLTSYMVHRFRSIFPCLYNFITEHTSYIHNQNTSSCENVDTFIYRLELACCLIQQLLQFKKNNITGAKWKFPGCDLREPCQQGYSNGSYHFTQQYIYVSGKQAWPPETMEQYPKSISFHPRKLAAPLVCGRM